MSDANCLIAAALALAACVALAGPARADGTWPGALERGSAPVPQFGSAFAIDLGRPDVAAPTAADLEISLTGPDHSVLHFLFSPRTLSGDTVGLGSTVTGNYAGLAWSVFDNNRLFGNFALSGALNRQPMDDPTRRYAPLLSLHSTFQLGYDVGAQQSLSLALDHAAPAPYDGDRSAFGESLQLQYGYHF